ncbi:MAG: hypothetical protein AMJ54_08430 [Deltaproteobacteria bacterium SG8_13]|nr:MAG: hypothetical protein AMJ54_08430 [Deltaproteobacteria bacterium SG8_13]
MKRNAVFAAIIAVALLITIGCAKKTIVTEPYGGSSYPADTGQQTAAGTGAAGSDQSQDVREESLEEAGGRSRMLSAAAAAEREEFENQDILFEFDSAVLSEAAQEILRSKARWLQANTDANVIIEGHCDDRGTNEYNLALGEKRALNTRNFLVTLGVDPSRLSTVSYGEERPLETGPTEEARAKNRRAHFVIEL